MILPRASTHLNPALDLRERDEHPAYLDSLRGMEPLPYLPNRRRCSDTAKRNSCLPWAERIMNTTHNVIDSHMYRTRAVRERLRVCSAAESR